MTRLWNGKTCAPRIGALFCSAHAMKNPHDTLLLKSEARNVTQRRYLDATKKIGQRSNSPLARNASAPRQSKAPSIPSAARSLSSAPSPRRSSPRQRRRVLPLRVIPTDAAQCQARRRANRRCRSVAKPQPVLRSGQENNDRHRRAADWRAHSARRLITAG